MSQSIVIACEDCKVMAVIGQSSISKPLVLGRSESESADIERFMTDHMGHSLRIGDVSQFAYELLD